MNQFLVVLCGHIGCVTGLTLASSRASMGNTLIALTTLLVSVGPAWGQTVSGPELRGRIEQITDSELIVRGEDDRLHYVDTAAIPSVELGVLNPGDDVVITTKGDGGRGPIGRSVRQRRPAENAGSTRRAFPQEPGRHR